jgi:Transposase domain (DUF772)
LAASGIETRFMIGLLMLKHIYGLSDEGLCERWVYDPYFQHFTGEEFSSTSSRANAQTWVIKGSGLATSWKFSWPRACGWRTPVARCGPAISSE